MDERKLQVINALKDERWDWRTVQGISRDTGLPEFEVQAILEASPDDVIRSRKPDEQGRLLYTARSRYNKRRGLIDTI